MVEEDEEEAYQGPYWRSNGAIFLVLHALRAVEDTLGRMLEQEVVVATELKPFFRRYPDPTESDEEMEAFAEILSPLWELESELGIHTRTANLAAAIDLESTVNRFCYFNLGEVMTDTIERLSVQGKIEVAHNSLGLPEFKGSPGQNAVLSLFRWRDKFAHGKCTDMPARSIRENHLTSPDTYPEPGDDVQELLELMRHYLVASEHIRSISRHSYTSSRSLELSEVEDELTLIKAFRFRDGRVCSWVDPKP